MLLRGVYVRGDHSNCWLCGLFVTALQAQVLKCYRVNNETRNLWALTAVGMIAGFIFTWATAMQI